MHGNEIRIRRDKLKWSREKLSRKVGCSASSIVKWELKSLELSDHWGPLIDKALKEGEKTKREIGQA